MPLAGSRLFSEEKCHRDFKIAFDFGFVAVESVASALSLDTVVQMAMRVAPCACGRLTFDGADLTREHLACVATGGLTACKSLILAALDYAHRTHGRPGVDALVREFCAQAPSRLEPLPLGVLLHRVKSAALQAEQPPSGCRHIHDAVTWPSSAESRLPELSPFPERPPLRRRARQR